MMRRMLFAAVVAAWPAVVWAQAADSALYELFAEDWAWRLEHSPETATYVGHPANQDTWGDYSAQGLATWQAHESAMYNAVRRIDIETLSDDAARMNANLFEYDLSMDVAGHAFPDELQPINQMGGIQQDAASLVANMRRSSVKDYENIVARLRALDTRIAQEVDLMKRGLEAGVTPPRITLRDVPQQVANQVTDDVMESPLLWPFTVMPESIPEGERERLLAEAKGAVETEVFPAYRKLQSFLEDEYLPGARESIAATDLPDGEAWYAYNVRRMTTTDMTPAEIHELGLSEVARIRGEMEAVIKETEFDGTFDGFLEFLRTDAQFYHTEARELMRGYRDIAKRIDAALPTLFATLPRLPYGVTEVPSYAEQSQTTAYYMPGAAQAGRPGYFYANTYKLETRPKWEMEALTLHEAVPGHHLQIALAQELENVPEFRKFGGPTAFVEGWGLYAESLGEELGMYEDPYSKFGQLTYEMWRAVRLVVDTGMHAFGWSRERAIEFFAENSSKPLHDITVEIDRYIVWPGQALAYKIGELKIKELRARASEELGEDFDVRLFHDAVLANGAIPLDLLEREIDGWIAGRR